MSAAVSPPVAAAQVPLEGGLPDSLPLLPLEGVILMPRARLPLNIFEPRYVAMIEDSLAGGRFLGLVQPNLSESTDRLKPVLYRVGCMGRITSFTETEEGRFLISLTGVSRFALAEEWPQEDPYRRARPDWEKYSRDRGEAEETEIDRTTFITLLKSYFKLHNIVADWNLVQHTPNDALISSLAMVCPLAPSEKQALLEAPDLRARADLLMALLEMATLSHHEGGVRH